MGHPMDDIDRLESENHGLRDLVASLRAENAALRERVAGEDARCRRIAQGIIETIGSVGPENAEDAAARACAEILCLRERVAVLERVRDAAKDAVNWVDNSEWRYALYRALAAAKPAAQRPTPSPETLAERAPPPPADLVQATQDGEHPAIHAPGVEGMKAVRMPKGKEAP